METFVRKSNFAKVNIPLKTEGETIDSFAAEENQINWKTIFIGYTFDWNCLSFSSIT
jgi:hypothetical protein